MLILIKCKLYALMILPNSKMRQELVLVIMILRRKL